MEILRFEGTPFAENCFVLKDGREAIVIDPGEATPELLRSVESLSVRTIVDTHGHGDHCGGNAALIEATGAELACHEADLPLLRTLPAQGRMFGVPFPPSPEPHRLLNEADTVEVGDVSGTGTFNQDLILSEASISRVADL